jgi:hypothetical protein
MELAWQKERDSQKKLINELNTMARDLKSTLLVRNDHIKRLIILNKLLQ